MEKGIISYGQHYLESEEVKNCLIDSADLNKKDIVVEIGAGDGRITTKIADKAGKVISYEIDEKTRAVLEKLCKEKANITINFENFLTAKLPNANKIVASLPYQITEPFIEKIKNIDSLERVTLLVGKTFGVLADKKKEQKISKLLLLVRCYFNGEYIQDVAKENFNPPPNTMSSIINLFPKNKKELINEPALFVMREIFEQRDKKVSNALREGIIRLYAEKGIIKTKRETKEFIKNYFEEGILDCYLEQMNNSQIEDLFNKMNVAL